MYICVYICIYATCRGHTPHARSQGHKRLKIVHLSACALFIIWRCRVFCAEDACAFSCTLSLAQALSSLRFLFLCIHTSWRYFFPGEHAHARTRARVLFLYMCHFAKLNFVRKILRVRAREKRIRKKERVCARNKESARASFTKHKTIHKTQNNTQNTKQYTKQYTKQ